MRKKRKIIAYVLSMALMLTSLPIQLFAQVKNDVPVPMTALVDTQTTTPGAIQINPNKYIGDGYEVEFKVTDQWAGAFNGEFVLANTSDKPLENWTLKFDFEHEITNMWNAQIVTHEANSYIIKNQEYNQDVAPGSSVNIGFQANWNDEIKVPESYNLLVSKQEVGDTDYTVDFKVTGDWGQAFNGEISITNNTKETIEDWTLEFDFDRNIERFWTAEIIKHEGEHYVIKNDGYNANIEPEQTIILGFSGSTGNVDSKPENYVLNQLSILIDDWEIDSDEDKLPDFLEKNIGTNPHKLDTDDDGLSDAYEYLISETNPIKSDTNDDGISDADEDLDYDGLSNVKECEIGTNASSSDTDQDGLNDYDEVYLYATNPCEYDTDGDLLSDGDEIVLGLDPNAAHTYSGILDSEYVFTQNVTGDYFESINTDNDIYKLTLDADATGSIVNHLIAEESNITSVMDDNRAITGKVVHLNYEEGKLISAKIKFEIENSFLNSTQSVYPDIPLFQTIERYQVFRYDRELHILYPVETTYDKEQNLVVGNVTQLGDYCLIDMEKWLYDLGVIEDDIPDELILKKSKDAFLDRNMLGSEVLSVDSADTEGEVFNQIEEYQDISYENLAEIFNEDVSLISETNISTKSREATTSQIFTTAATNVNSINKQADLVFVIDTTGSMGSYIANVKSSIAEVIQYLRNKNITLHVSFIDYQDITYDGINSTTVHELNGNTWLYNTSDMLKVLSSISLGNGGDGPETPIDGLGYAEQLNYRSSAYKFVVLVTDENYKVDNRHGIANLSEIANRLDNKGINVCVAGAYSYYKELYTDTNGIGMNISNFSSTLEKHIDTMLSGELNAPASCKLNALSFCSFR